MHGRNELGRVASRNLLLGGLTDMRDDLLAGEMAILDRLREGTASNTGVPSLSRCWRSGRAGVPGAVSVVCCVARQTEMLQMLNHEREGRPSTVWMPEEARNTRTRSESRMQPLDRAYMQAGTPLASRLAPRQAPCIQVSVITRRDSPEQPSGLSAGPNGRTDSGGGGENPTWVGVKGRLGRMDRQLASSLASSVVLPRSRMDTRENNKEREEESSRAAGWMWAAAGQNLNRTSDGPTGTFSRHNAWRGTWRVGLGLQTLDPGTRRRPYWPI